MPITKRQKAMNKEHELVAYFKALSKEMGYSFEELGERIGISQGTLYRRFENPKRLTVGEIDKICQILHPEEQYELRLRGFTR